MKNRKGKVYIVGAGPGDPELISVKGLKALRRADCILYDSLSSAQLLTYARKAAEKICVGKSDVAVLSGRKSNGRALDAPECDTLVYLMAVATVKEVVSALLRSGRPKNEPCAFIEQGTTPAERIIYGRLGNIAEKARRSSLRAPAVFIVGKVVDYGRKLYAHKFNPQDHALERKGIGRGHETSEEKYGKHGY